LTATADPVTLSDMRETLSFTEGSYKLYTHKLDRPNISYSVFPKSEEYRQTLDIIKHEGLTTCGIIYCGTRNKCEDMEKFLLSKGINCSFFHAGMRVKDKEAIQEKYINKTLNLIIATVAFGMGIDRSDVRYVINVDMPNSMEELSQMSGRASRDGKPANSYVLYSFKDYQLNQWLLRKTLNDPARISINSEKLLKVRNYCETSLCRRSKILTYFGESPPTYCGSCDNCNQ
jgi:ATP-dependent DNA helicase RecQ